MPKYSQLNMAQNALNQSPDTYVSHAFTRAAEIVMTIVPQSKGTLESPVNPTRPLEAAPLPRAPTEGNALRRALWDPEAPLEGEALYQSPF